MLKLWAIVGGAVSVFLSIVAWQVYTSYKAMLLANPTASAMQISQLADQHMVEFMVLCVLLLAALVLLKAGELIYWDATMD